MKKYIKAISVFLTIAYLVTIPLNAMAAIARVGKVAAATSTAESTLLTKWKGLGLLDSSVTINDLNQSVIKIDFITFINKILNTSKQAEINFSDVPKNSWYGKEVSKAVASGFVKNGNNTKFEPFSNITRLDAAIMVSSVFGLELKDQNILNKITDAQKLNNEQLKAFGSVVERGYLSEISTGRYAPLGVIKLIDAMKMLDKCIGQVISKGGTYTAAVNGNLLVNSGAVTLKNMEITGDLIIGEGVADGVVTIDGVTVKGKMVIRGGGPNSVYILNTKLGGTLTVEKYAGNVRVVAMGTTSISDTVMKSGGKLIESGLTSGRGFINVTFTTAVAGNQTANLEGTYNNVQMNNSNLNVNLNGQAESVNISKDSTASFTLQGGNAKNITTLASKSTIQITGGTVGAITVESGAKGNRLDINGSTTIAALTLRDATTLNFTKGSVDKFVIEPTAGGSYLTIAKDATVNNALVNSASTFTGLGRIISAYVYANGVNMDIRPSSVYVSSGITANINGMTQDPTKNTVSITVPSEINVAEKETQTINISSKNPYNSNISFISSDNKIATVSDKGEVKGITAGQTTVHVTADAPNYNTKVVAIKVNVTSGNVTKIGSLAISPASAESGTLLSEMTILYTAGDDMSNGTVIIKLPKGISVDAKDTYKINGGEEKVLDSSQRPDIQTVAFTNLNLKAGDNIEVILKSKYVPNGNTYEFVAISDADATGPKLPTSGQEKAVFTADSLKQLVENYNYKIPEVPYGTTGGSIKITNLSFIGITSANDLKWIVKVQTGAFATPTYDDDMSSQGFTSYTDGQDIMVTSGQTIRLAVVDGNNKLKAYKDIAVQDNWIRPDNALILTAGVNYNNPIQGIMANSVVLGGLHPTGTGTSWMIKVQDAAAGTVFANSEFVGATAYTEGDDISVYQNQHIILAEVAKDSSNRNIIKAYADIAVNSADISKTAGSLILENNFSAPTFGATPGTTTITTLAKGTFAIDNWMYVIINKDAVKPSLDAAAADYEKYTKNGDGSANPFKVYTANTDITVTEGQHILLIGVSGAANLIKAYADIKIDGSQIRQADAPQIPDGNFSPPVMGSTANTTKFTDLNFNTTSGSSIFAEAKKFMIRVQNDPMTVDPQYNSMLSGAVDITVNKDITVAIGQHVILVATDASGKIKAWRDIEISSSMIRPTDALKLITPNDYALPQPGNKDGSTKIILSSNGVTGFSAWYYKLSDNAFEIPYKGSDITSGAALYTSGADIENMTVGKHILIFAVDATGKTLAYADVTISYDQIKQPNASELVSILEVPSGQSYNYSIPEPGLSGGTTRIATLSTMGVQGAIKWMYKISDTPATVPQYNVVLSGLYTYLPGDSVKVTKGQYFVLYAVDSYNRIKAYKNIQINSESQIRTPAATVLVTPTNYSAPSSGTVQGTTVFSALSFAGLSGVDGNWKWKYSIGSTTFNAPAMNTTVSAIGFTTYDLVKDGNGNYPNIAVTAGQYILLLAVDGSDCIKAYASVYVPQTAIKPFDAPTIDPASYTLVKGTGEGTTSFNKLSLTGIVGATGWMVKTQATAFTTPSLDVAVSGSKTYSLNDNIPIAVGHHVLLMATDQLGKVKAYTDIVVSEAAIQAPFAQLLTENTNYTLPEAGVSPGAIKIMLNDANIANTSGGAVVWKYRVGTSDFATPHLDDDASGTEYTTYTSNEDIQVKAGNVVLIVATVGGKIKAFRQFTISASQIRPPNAADLVAGTNYTGPVAGSAPGTTKINDLKLIGIVGADRWMIKVVTTPSALTLDSTFTTPTNYASGMDISVKLNQYVVLAAVDAFGKVKAYKNIQITQSGIQLNPPLADKLTSVLNYSTPKYGTVTGTTSLFVSPQGLNNFADFVVRIVNTPESIIAGTDINYTTTAGITFDNNYAYTSGANIGANAGQYILLMAVDTNGKILAYENIPLTSSQIRPGNAVQLQSPANYSALQPGAAIGNTKFSALDFFGVPGDPNTWLIKVQDVDLNAAPLMNSSVENGSVYTVNKDIPVKEGQFVILYAVDATGKIKGYISLQVIAGQVRGIAPVLKYNNEYYSPKPGVELNATKFDSLKLPADATKWKYIVQDSAAGTMLKDSLPTGLTAYTIGHDIFGLEGQHLILCATDDNGYLKAYADIILTADNIKNVVATISGTVITAPTGESNIVAGGRTIVVSLDITEWQDDVLTNTTKRNMLFDGFVAAGDEAVQWGKVIAALKNEGLSAVSMSADKKTITITLSEATTYDITKTQEITLTIKPELIRNAVKAVVAADKLKISANVILQLEGTAVTQGLGEGDIVGGGKTIILSLLNGSFATDVASSQAKRDAIFDNLTVSTNASEWAKVVAALKAAGEGAITRNSSQKVTIVLPAATGYDINTNDALTVKVPCSIITSGGAIDEILVGAIKDATASQPLIISAISTATLSGTLVTGGAISEIHIVTGGKTLVVTLKDGQWVTDIETDKTKRDALFSGLLTSSEATEWAKVVAALKTAGQGAIKRNDNNTVTITLPATTGYNIASNQYVTLNIPSTCIIGARANLLAGETITIERLATATLAGTAVGSGVNESVIRAGGKTIIITLQNASWVDDIATNTAAKDALFDGFTADVEPAEWAKVVAAMKTSATVTRSGTAGNILTIILPAVTGAAGYDIAASLQTVAIVIPTAAAIGTSFEIPVTGALTISSTLPTAAKVVSVTAPTGTYKQGDDILITVSFDQAVDVVGSGTPVLNLSAGTTARDAIYVSGTGTKNLVFVYTVQAGDSAAKLNYKATGSLVTSGVTIQNTGTTVKATLTLPTLTSDTSLIGSNVLVDAIAPKFVTGYPKAGTNGENGSSVIVKVDEKSKVYFVAVPTAANITIPTAGAIIEEVVTGGAISGAAISVGMKGLSNLEATTDTNIVISNLASFTEYTVYMVAVDALGNTGLVSSSLKFKTTDATAPAMASGYPVQSGTKYDNQIKVLINVNEAGNVYAVALPEGSAAPTSAQVKAYKNASGTAVATKGNLIVTSGAIGTELELVINGVSVSSHYDVYVVCEDASLNMTSPAAIKATTSQLNLNNVGVDLSKSLLTNTTAQMEYSFDEITWKVCVANSTKIDYNADAEILTIYIREAANTTNERMLDAITRASESLIDLATLDYDIAAGKITNSSMINLQYRVNGGVWGALNASGSAINVQFVPGKLEIRTAATQTSLPSIAVVLDDIAVPMPAPDLKYDDNSNSIYGLSGEYEYRINGGAWTTGAAEGIFTGSKLVEIRAKATKDKVASSIQTINFTAGMITVVAYPAAKTAVKKNTVVITFEESTNKAYLSSASNIADMVKQYFKVGQFDTDGTVISLNDWGTDFTATWNTTGNAITLVYTSMTGASIKIGDEIRIDPAAGIKNSAGTATSYSSIGMLEGSFHTVPALVSIKAVNSGSQLGFGTGDSLVLTFDQPTKATTFSAVELSTFLKVTDSTGKDKSNVWGAVTTDSAIVWNSDGTKLTITFNNVTNPAIRLLPGSDKITVSETLGLTDADQTTEACNTSAFVSGSFTSPPAIQSVVIANGGSANNVNTGDTITITFDQATNKKAITSSTLINYFKLTTADGKTTHSWGVQSGTGIVWSADGRTLTITISSISGLSLKPGDVLTINPLAGIKDADGGTTVSDSCIVTGSY